MSSGTTTEIFNWSQYFTGHQPSKANFADLKVQSPQPSEFPQI